MTRIGWIAMLLAVALWTAGCSKSDTQTNGDAKDGKSTSGANADSLPPSSTPNVPENVDGQKVTGAVGKALLKGFSGSAEKKESGDAPTFNP